MDGGMFVQIVQTIHMMLSKLYDLAHWLIECGTYVFRYQQVWCGNLSLWFFDGEVHVVLVLVQLEDWILIM